ncbi:hypothetical protein M758_6G163100 [Ceratodon purpureus]|nr:hypothetical protein M758_6G163100 [Ceratodon purpureus]
MTVPTRNLPTLNLLVLMVFRLLLTKVLLSTSDSETHSDSERQRRYQAASQHTT